MPSRFSKRQSMTILAFDCAVSGLSVAVVRDGSTLAQCREEGRGQAATLLPAIARSSISSQFEVVSYAQVGKNAAPFRHVNKSARNDSRRLFPLDCVPCELNGALGRAQHPGDCAVERRFTDAI